MSFASNSTTAGAPTAPSVDDAIRAVADPTRRAILRLVRDDERSAGDLAARFPAMSRPAVSQHLRVLTDAGLVTFRRDGNRRLYRSRIEGLAAVRSFLDEMWSDGLARLKSVAEREQQTRDRPTAKPSTRKKNR